MEREVLEGTGGGVAVPGARVHRREECAHAGDGRPVPDLDRLRAMVTPTTRLIVFSNSNTPTGSLMDEAMLRAIEEIARPVAAWVLSDEVYRGIDPEGSGFTAAMADLYERGSARAACRMRTRWLACDWAGSWVGHR